MINRHTLWRRVRGIHTVFLRLLLVGCACGRAIAQLLLHLGRRDVRCAMCDVPDRLVT